jgi:hypothetical protein
MIPARHRMLESLAGQGVNRGDVLLEEGGELTKLLGEY